jgi:transposase
MDNLPAHKGPRVEQLIKATGAELRCLPAYSSDMNSIEKAFSKLKAFLRKFAERTAAGDARPRSLRGNLQDLGAHKLVQILWLSGRNRMLGFRSKL